MIRKLKQSSKKLFYITICIFVFNLQVSKYSYSEDSFLAETCYLENNYVLLYKIINWWNDSEPGDDNLICSNHLRCELTGMSTLRYDSLNESLTINSNYQIEELISFFKECKNCKGPSHFKCTYLNEKYFDPNSIKNIPLIYSTINSIMIKSVPNKLVHELIENEKKIRIELEGTIGGLLLENGKISFHHSGDFLKECPQATQNQTNQPKTYLTIKNTEKNVIIARYTAID